MAMGYDGAFDTAADGIDVEATGRAIEAPWRRAEQVFGADHVGKYECWRAVSQFFRSAVLQLTASRV
jgi:hypothetical protein